MNQPPTVAPNFPPTPAPTRARERGIALPMVLGVLVCLLALAIPFSLSMRHERNSVAVRLDRHDARREARMLADVAIGQVRQGLPDRDETPWWDDAEDLVVDSERLAEDLGGVTLGPGGRIWSVDVEDLAGRMQLDATPFPVIARTLGLSTRLGRNLEADAEELRVTDGEALLDSGFVWIEGEVTHYGRREGNTLYDLTRPAVVPGVWEPADIADLAPREFENGTEVIDFRAYLIALWGLRVGPKGARFDTVDQALSIAQFGFGALTEAHRSILERWFTVYRRDVQRDLWVDPQRVNTVLSPGVTRAVNVSGGQFYGPGSVVRLRNGRGETECCLVVANRTEADGTHTLGLEMPVRIEAQAFDAIVECRRRAPIDVNLCDPDLLAKLLTDLPHPRSERAISESLAHTMAAAIVAARPLDGPKALDAVLDARVTDGTLTREQRNAIYTNAHHAGDVRVFGTLPFSYRGEGTVDLRAAAAIDFPISAKERARASLHEIVSVSGSGQSVVTFASQRDFEEPFRLSRRARSWTTFPENLGLFHGSESFADPPSRVVGENEYDLGRFASEGLIDIGVRLAPARLLGYSYDSVGVGSGGVGTTDVTLHCDSGDWLSDQVDGWNLSRGAPPPLPTSGNAAGGRAVAANGRGDGRSTMVNVTSNPAGVDFLRPFGVSMFWNTGPSRSPVVLFDLAVEETEDRVLLRFDGQALEFQVFDVGQPLAQSGGPPPIATLRYEFDDGLPLEADTWYHVTAYCKGNQPSQMALFVDQRARGKRFFQTRTAGRLNQGQRTSKGGVAAPPIRVDDASKFPPRGVLKLGGEIVEYTSRDDRSFYLDPDDGDPFGGRAARGSHRAASDLLEHEANTNVELYGYTTPLVSTLPVGDSALGANLGRFYVARLDEKDAKDPIILQGTRAPIPLGPGWEADADTFKLVSLNGQDRIPEDAFDPKGGYALLVTVGNPGAEVRVGPGENARLDQTTQGSLLGGTECIYYGSYKDGEFRNVKRAQALGADFPDNLRGTDVQQPHAFLSKSGFFPTIPFFPVLVLPISVRVGGGLSRGFPIPERVNDISYPELLQIDLDFVGADQDEPRNATEWVRYDSVRRDLVIRDSRQAVEALWRYLGTQQNGNGFDTDVRIFDIANNPDRYRDDYLEEFFAKINYERLPDVDPPGNDWPQESLLAFRGVLGTVNSKHTSASRVLPVFRVRRWGGEEGAQVRPGRHDDLTIVHESGQRKDVATINYAWSQPGPPDILVNPRSGGRGVSHVGLRAGIPQQYVPTQGIEVEPSAGQAAATLTQAVFDGESRLQTRIVKFPSGELPTKVAPQLFVGQDHRGVATGDGLVDEVRVFSSPDPDEQLALARMVFQSDLREDQEDDADLHEDAFWLPNRLLGGVVAQAFQALELVPQDAVVIQAGDEVMLVDRVVTSGPKNFFFAEEGRGALGTEPAFHHRLEPVMVLPWFVVSTLQSSLGAGDTQIQLADCTGFPPAGFVQIGTEVVGYSHNSGALQSQVTQGSLNVPALVHSDPDDVLTAGRGDAAWRGRFGTRPDNHQSGDFVIWLLHRYPDTYVEDADFPELAAFELSVPVRRGWFQSLTWREKKEGSGPLDPLVVLVAQARVSGEGRFDGNPGDDPDLFFFDQPGGEEENTIGRSGDLLRVRFLTKYLDGALDPIDMNRNSWKRAPTLEMAAVEYFGDRVVEFHAEQDR